MSKYWENASGCYDPILAKVIESENLEENERNREVHDIINQIKNFLDKKGLKLINRIELQDKQTGKVYK